MLRKQKIYVYKKKSTRFFTFALVVMVRSAANWLCQFWQYACVDKGVWMCVLKLNLTIHRHISICTHWEEWVEEEIKTTSSESQGNSNRSAKENTTVLVFQTWILVKWSTQKYYNYWRMKRYLPGITYDWLGYGRLPPCRSGLLRAAWGTPPPPQTPSPPPAASDTLL